ncbi:tetratricopeptide repeat protein [Lutibacter agarilyticus]|uniref:tetratricopeptide repeat protein n=1 Tax=Lutibacter agarilyticus TaxID=1109740 RepID=UPI001C3D41F8|nr:hypothetical protein [Lutibacter agarilyticus]
MGILAISSSFYAQELIDEEKKLEFQTHFFEALKQKAINNYAKAIESLELCMAIDASSKAVEFEFSKNYLELKKYFEAEIFIDKALLKDTNNVHLLKHKVAIYKAQRNFEAAIKIQQKIVETRTEYSDELVLLYLQNRNFEKAASLIVEIEDKALATSKIKGYKQYLENRKKAIEKTTDKPKINTEIVDISTLKKEYANNKEFKILQQILKTELSTESFDLLYSDSKDALELFPTQPFLYLMNGLALNKLVKYNEAIAVLSIGIDFVIDNNELEASYYEQLSIAYEGLDKKNEALKYKQKAEKLRQHN